VKIAVVGGGAGGAAAVAELVSAGHEVRLWSRTHETLAPFREQGGVAFDGIIGSGLAKPAVMTCDLAEATDGADLILICVPTLAHKDVADALARNRSSVPIVLNPGHTGGALEVRQAFIANACEPPPIAEFSTLTYVARKYTPARVTITGKAKSVRLAALPGGEQAAGLAKLGLRVVGRQRGKLRDAQIFPATGAENTGLRRKLRAAEIADGGAGKTQNRSAAKGARGGEQCTGERVCGTSKHTNNSAPNRSLRQRDVGSQVNSLTRKDAPHSRPARLRSALPPLCRVYG